MRTQPPRPDRPFAITLIALFQLALAAYLLYFAAIAYMNPTSNLTLLRSALRILIGRTDTYSYAKASHQEVMTDLFFMAALATCIAIYSAIAGWGLWRLKKWARHAVAGYYGGTAILWARSFLFFGVSGGFTRVPSAVLQPVYIVVLIETMICMTLLFHGGVAEAFGEVE